MTVCTWEPQHTLARVEAQQLGVQDGSIAALVKKYGRGTDRLQAALLKAKLTSVVKSPRGEAVCAECEALAESVLARPGITDRVEAVRDVVQDFNKAIERTRAAR